LDFWHSIADRIAKDKLATVGNFPFMLWVIALKPDFLFVLLNAGNKESSLIILIINKDGLYKIILSDHSCWSHLSFLDLVQYVR